MVVVHDVCLFNFYLFSVGIWLKARTLKSLGLYHGVFVLQVWTRNPVERVELLGLPGGQRSVLVTRRLVPQVSCFVFG